MGDGTEDGGGNLMVFVDAAASGTNPNGPLVRTIEKGWGCGYDASVRGGGY